MSGPRPRIEAEPDVPDAAGMGVRQGQGPALDPPPAAYPELPTLRVAVREPAAPRPRIEAEDVPAARLQAAELVVAVLPRQGWSMPALALSGCMVLGLGLAGLQAGNFVADQFARNAVLGWVTLGVAVAGFGLIGAGLVRELRGLLALRTVDRLRQDLAGTDAGRRQRAARAWLRHLPDGPALLPAIDAVNDPDAILALLRAGPEATLRARADALGRTAALQVVAGMAAAPAPALVVLLVSWRGLRLLRQVAAAYGLRPGMLGTIGLLRRTALAAGAAAVTEVAVNAAAHGLLTMPVLQHLAGEMAGGAVAARRMVVLARAAAVACSPVPRE